MSHDVLLSKEAAVAAAAPSAGDSVAGVAVHMNLCSLPPPLLLQCSAEGLRKVSMVGKDAAARHGRTESNALLMPPTRAPAVAARVRERMYRDAMMRLQQLEWWCV